MTIVTRVKIALALAAVVVIAAVAGWLLVTKAGLRADLAERDGRLTVLEARLIEAERHSAAQALELDQNRRALAASEAVNQQLTRETAALRDRLNEVYAHDEDAANWRDVPCPGGVRDCLLN